MAQMSRFVVRSRCCIAALGMCWAAAAMAQDTFKIGIVSFMSGQAAESFGIPAVNGAKVLIDAFNKGQAPAPFNQPGIGGMQIEAKDGITKVAMLDADGVKWCYDFGIHKKSTTADFVGCDVAGFEDDDEGVMVLMAE